MRTDRIREIGAGLYDYAILMLDAESDVSDETAGYVADKVQRAFEYAVLHDDCDALAGRIICDAQRDGVLEYTCECLEEHTDIRGNVSASGDDAYDRAIEDSILQDHYAGNKWAWCTVRVACKVPRYAAIGDNYLGCCNWASREDFECSCTYDDMKGEALQSLHSALRDDLEKAKGAMQPF